MRRHVLASVSRLWALGLLTGLATGQEFAHANAAAELARSHVGKNKSVGIAIGVRASDARWTHGVGHVAKSDGATPNEDTLFELGSISKVFNGILLADCVERKHVALDDPVQHFLRSEATMPKGEARAITLEDLALHRSGLPRMPANFRPRDPLDPYVDYDVDALYEELAETRLRAQPGTAYEYSNLATGLLGHALSRACETPYAELLARRVIEPLGLESTGIGIDAESAKLASVYSALGKPVQPWNFDVLAPAGAVRSSVRDMLLFIDANLGRRAKPMQSTLELARQVRTTDLPRMGLGWHVLKRGEHEIWWHNGMTGGSASFCGVCPKRELGIVALSNTARSVDSLALALFDLILGE